MKLMLRAAAWGQVVASAFHHATATATTAATTTTTTKTAAFNHHHAPKISCFPRVTMTVGVNNNSHGNARIDETSSSSSSSRRRRALSGMLAAGGGGGGGFFSGLFGDSNDDAKRGNVANAADVGVASKGPTNEVVKSVNGMRQRRLGGSDIVVSELGLGTQRW
jgi:hypothetical protein